MSWDRILQNDPGAGVPLRQRIDELFAEQRLNWPMLNSGEAALGHLQKKTLTSGSDSVIVQMNPARRASTQAKTDAASVAARKCFLCPENMPLEERGMAFEDLVLMPNPFPVLPMHCTIAAREHRPQAIAGQVAQFLRLARAVAPDLAVFYNGPRCGASAPDHFHFQCARADGLPILKELPVFSGGGSVTPISSFGRSMLFVASVDAGIVARLIDLTYEASLRGDNSAEEPMLNLLAYHNGNHFTAIVFPRRAHRPACYFAEGADRIAVSPAILEMCGILVVTSHQDFERIDADIARRIYVEVSGPAQQ
jgi:hypothetical protein